MERWFVYTLIPWLTASVGGALNIAMVVAIPGYFGVETTTFAAGVFLSIRRPFEAAIA